MTDQRMPLIAREPNPNLYPNLAAILAGCVSGPQSEWPAVAVELRKMCEAFCAELERQSGVISEERSEHERLQRTVAFMETTYLQEHGGSWGKCRFADYAEEATQVLEAMVAEYCDYTIRNNLGDPEKQHNIKWARATLAKNQCGGSGSLSETPRPSTAHPLPAGLKPEQQLEGGPSASGPATQPEPRTICHETGREIVLDFETGMFGTKVWRCKRCDCSFTYDPATHECHQSGKKPMNQATWPALREYIAAEIALSHARRDYSEASARSPMDESEMRDIAARVGRLEEQSTRMETAFRESLP